MRKFVKTIFVFLIILFLAITLVIFWGAAKLNEYSKVRVDDEVIALATSNGQTQFYRYDFISREERIGEPVLIEDAMLNSSIRYEYVPYNELPEDVINAFVAIEDKRFWNHNGIDYLRSTKAVFNYIFGGRKSFGGSTITQQLVKNLTGNDEYLIKRKLTEAFSAINLERYYDKSEILEMYLNIINLSNGCRGVGAAAKYYFSKNINELCLSEIASIAAITNNPSKYDPIRHPKENKKRRDLVLDCMLELGYISSEQHRDAKCEDIKLTIEKKTSGINSWYIDTVIEDVIRDMASKYGISRKTASLLLYKGGYKIYTLMDDDIQGIIDDYYTDMKNFPQNSDGSIPQSAIVVMDPYTGDILGIAGAVGEKRGNRVFNFATDSKRPSGSAIKPLSVYAPAIERGLINWSTIVNDSPITEGVVNKLPWPSNANKKYVGDVTVEYAIKNSLNTVAVKVLRTLGNRASFDFLTEKLNMTSLKKEADLGDASLALGQHSVGISLRELVCGYTIFEEGIMSRSRTYSKVTDSNGKIILDNKCEQNSVISTETAAIMTKLLQGVTEDGTAEGYITLNDFCEVAGKTGTTQYNFDKYFIGYTPSLLAGVWVGYEMPRSLDYIGGNLSTVIWNDIMNEIYNKTDLYSTKTRFSVPRSVIKLSYNNSTGLPPSEFDKDEDTSFGWFNVKNVE